MMRKLKQENMLLAKANQRLAGMKVIDPKLDLSGGVSVSSVTRLTSEFGAVHSREEVAGWMREAGFEKTAFQALPPPWPEGVVLGHKP